MARPGGDTWRHRMPVGIRSVQVGEGEVSADAVRYLNGEVIARAALPPGGRLFVVRYQIGEDVALSRHWDDAEAPSHP